LPHGVLTPLATLFSNPAAEYLSPLPAARAAGTGDKFLTRAPSNKHTSEGPFREQDRTDRAHRQACRYLQGRGHARAGVDDRRTGAQIKIKAAKVPKFRPGKALKDALN
jgi:hypothetical protein